MIKYCKPSSVKSVMVQICPLLAFLFYNVFKGQEYAIGLEKKRKCLSVGKEEMNLSLSFMPEFCTWKIQIILKVRY